MDHCYIDNTPGCVMLLYLIFVNIYYKVSAFFLHFKYHILGILSFMKLNNWGIRYVSYASSNSKIQRHEKITYNCFSCPCCRSML